MTPDKINQAPHTCTCGGEIGPRNPENDLAYHIQQWDEE